MTSDSQRLSRRAYLAGAGAAATVGLAGCVDLGGSDELTLAHMPIFPDLQYYVMEAEGYLDDVDATIESREFTDGPAIVQAFGGDELDVAMFGVVPSMIVIDRGIPAKVTATNIKEPMAIMAHEEFHSMWDEHGADAFGVWEEEKGRKFRFGTFPQGSVPDVLLRYWLQSEVGVDPTEAAEILEISGANAVWQAIANGEVDGTSIMEPVPTRADQEGSPVSTFRTAADIMPGQPAAVTLMRDEVRNSPVATQFLEAHVNATEFIDANPEGTAQIVEDSLGMPADQALAALQGPLSNFVTDPHEIENGTEIFAEFAHENGQIDEQLSLDQIFDYSVYEGL
ncbi:NitT/TauT family transport system substrate-binding protein [Halomicrobium zhouii]|uniref:NitT/TauT family transport system substrate-binding protein n=1 Tax=Halomicrobium zhouii TaxID=767519 RepID=A0A1I6KQJ0_9EURY|nr:ABC transporter substrate-binding protein [Halomicrobium zhouii]SFR93447.1 NitT/TauT family transport system substrate-binding protein [Halomicrobium zhouii]